MEQWAEQAALTRAARSACFSISSATSTLDTLYYNDLLHHACSVDCLEIRQTSFFYILYQLYSMYCIRSTCSIITKKPKWPNVRFYRVIHLVNNLGGVDFDLGVPPSCPSAQPLLPNSHQPRQNWADSGTLKIQVTQPSPRYNESPCRYKVMTWHVMRKCPHIYLL